MSETRSESYSAEFSRRDLLQGATAGIAATVAGAVLTGCNRASVTSAGRLVSAGALTPESMPKRFSQEEMNRRWNVVRAAMKEQGFDGLLVTTRTEGFRSAQSFIMAFG